MTGLRTPPNGQSAPASTGEGGPEPRADARPHRAGPDAAAVAAPTALHLHELGRIRAAEHHARRVYPGAVGELVARELRAYHEFGYRFQDAALVSRVARQVLALPVPPDPG